MTRHYFLAALLFGLGLAGVAVVASRAAQSITGTSAPDHGARSAPGRAAGGAPEASRRARPTATRLLADRGAPSRRQPAGTPPVTRERAEPGARPRATSAGGAPASPARPGQADAAAPAPAAARPAVSAPATGAEGPPRQPGPSPALVIHFAVNASRPGRADRRAVRRLVNEHGYKGVYYRLTAFAAERSQPRRNQYLARKRCRRVASLIHKAGGVSRRWIRCMEPVFRTTRGKAEGALLGPAWRRVEIRVEK